jgi:hypothetical protein
MFEPLPFSFRRKRFGTFAFRISTAGKKLAIASFSYHHRFATMGASFIRRLISRFRLCFLSLRPGKCLLFSRKRLGGLTFGIAAAS